MAGVLFVDTLNVSFGKINSDLVGIYMKLRQKGKMLTILQDRAFLLW